MKMTKFFSYLFLLVFIGVTTVSCLDDDSNEPFYTYGFIPATAIDVNLDSIQPVSQPTNVKISFNLAGSCQEFLEFRRILPADANDTKIGVFGSQKNNSACTNDIITTVKTLKFTPTTAGEQTIRVWAGKDPGGADIYISKTITVPSE
ncbi:hypothetical protein [Faecalibacter bovis]|uniref:Lipoprotein n=1 Tax=Faecalibacter bovis TaxID=2898187 RepID=A0ABX7XFT4_9FLAO|nr:hypothetical protein [Faecalibacter bovis]MBS7333129.1 hypothetical protein [Weeksellaceae bacterium]QTV06822.1 hypothetical protein J9309_05770 [Faecalibacter bovis]